MCLGLGLFTITKALSGSLLNWSKCMPGYKIQGSFNIQVIWHFMKIEKFVGGGGVQLQRGGWSGGIYHSLLVEKNIFVLESTFLSIEFISYKAKCIFHFMIKWVHTPTILLDFGKYFDANLHHVPSLPAE